MKLVEQKCWTCGDTDVKHKTYRDALDEYELTCDKCHRIEYPEEYEEEEEEEEEEEWEYCNCGIEKEPRFGKISYMVAGGGLMNGNAYATVEFIPKGKSKRYSDQYYRCEYGNNPKREYIGDTIVWSDEIYDKENPYCSRNFNVIDHCDDGDTTSDEEEEEYCDGGCGKKEIWDCSDKNMCKTCHIKEEEEEFKPYYEVQVEDEEGEEYSDDHFETREEAVDYIKKYHKEDVENEEKTVNIMYWKYEEGGNGGEYEEEEVKDI